MKEKICSEELLDWKWNQIRLREKYSHTPPGFTDISSRDRLLAEWYQKKSQLDAGRQYDIESVPPLCDTACPVSDSRRKGILRRINALFASKSGPVFLYGLSGSGKTSIARSFADSHRGDYEHILFLHYNVSAQNTICDDRSVAITNLRYSREHYGTLRKYFLAKCRILSEIALREKLLIIIDDCNITDDRSMEQLFSVPADFLVTTCINPKLWNSYPAIPVRRFDGSGMPADGGPTVCSPDIFLHFPLKKDEKQALCYFAVLPAQGISREFFLRISGIGSDTIDRLLCYLYIDLSAGNSPEEEILFMPPAIAEAARAAFVPTPVSCSKLLTGFKNDLQDILEQPYSRKQQLKPYVLAFVRAFPEPVPWLSTAFGKLASMLSLLGHHTEAEEYSEKLFYAVKDYYGSMHQNTGRAALWAGMICENSMKYSEAESWFSRSLNILEKCGSADHTYLYLISQAYIRTSRALLRHGRAASALDTDDLALCALSRYLKQYGDFPAELDTDSRLMYASVLLGRAEALFCLGRSDDAETSLDEAFSYLDRMTSSPEYGSIEFYRFRAVLLMHRGEYAEAEKLARRNLETALEYAGETFPDTLYCRLLLASACAALGHHSEAVLQYDAAVGIIRREYPEPALRLDGTDEKYRFPVKLLNFT